MNVSEAINSRRSIRCFKSDPVPLDLLQKILEIARRSPSASNSQPWEFVVAAGTRLDEIKRAYTENSFQTPMLDLPIPQRYPEPWATRRRAVTAGLLSQLGIAREDKQKRAEWNSQSLKLWGAPCAIYIMIDRAYYLVEGNLNVWPIFDCGLITQNILLLATEYGLGTIPAVQLVYYPNILRKLLDIPDSKLILIGIAVGYPDPANPVNQFRTDREPLHKIAKFYI